MIKMNASNDNLKYLEALFAHNKYIYKEKKLIQKKEYLSNCIRILNRISSLICNDEEASIIREALNFAENVDKLRLAIKALTLSPN